VGSVEYGSRAPHGEAHWQRHDRMSSRVSRNVLYASPYVLLDKSEVYFDSGTFFVMRLAVFDMDLLAFIFGATHLGLSSGRLAC